MRPKPRKPPLKSPPGGGGAALLPLLPELPPELGPLVGGLLLLLKVCSEGPPDTAGVGACIGRRSASGYSPGETHVVSMFVITTSCTAAVV